MGLSLRIAQPIRRVDRQRLMRNLRFICALANIRVTCPAFSSCLTIGFPTSVRGGMNSRRCRATLVRRAPVRLDALGLYADWRSAYRPAAWCRAGMFKALQNVIDVVFQHVVDGHPCLAGQVLAHAGRVDRRCQRYAGSVDGIGHLGFTAMMGARRPGGRRVVQLLNPCRDTTASGAMKQAV